MTLWTILAYLAGRRDAIERIVADPWAFYVGLALVLSAGLARSYATYDLLKQPWRLLAPPAAALALSLLLFLVLAAKLPKGQVPWTDGLRSIAALVLLTAPLAWLYALPFESFLSWPKAVRARLVTLGVVAAWRVGLIVRCVAVLLDDRFLAALSLVLLMVVAVALGGLILTGFLQSRLNNSKERKDSLTPMLLGIMSGVEAKRPELPETRLMTRWTMIVAILGALSVPVSLIGVANLDVSAREWTRLLSASPVEMPGLDVWILAGGAAVFFCVLLPWTQRRPRAGSHVEALFRKGQINEGLAWMSAHRQADFLPGWQPPPEGDFRDPPTMLDVMEALCAAPRPEWLRQVYLERFRGYLADPLWYWWYASDLEKLARILACLPEGPALARQVLDAATPFEAKMKKHGLPEPKEDEIYDFIHEMSLHPEPELAGREESIAEITRIAQGASALET